MSPIHRRHASGSTGNGYPNMYSAFLQGERKDAEMGTFDESEFVDRPFKIVLRALKVLGSQPAIFRASRNVMDVKIDPLVAPKHRETTLKYILGEFGSAGQRFIGDPPHLVYCC